MGFLDNTSITVDAVLTKKGREKLASGIENFEKHIMHLQMMKLITNYGTHHTQMVQLTMGQF